MSDRSGHLDLCLQSHAVGWAMEGGAPAVVHLFINDVKIASTGKNRFLRNDLTPFGLPAEAGFIFHFPEPVGPNDVVAVRFDDGSDLINSPSHQHGARLKQMLLGIAGGPGLEFGPLDRPLLAKSQHEVFYVDHLPTEDLRLKYGHVEDPFLVDPKRIVDVDFVWQRGSLANAVSNRKFSWAIAGGVIEHIADPIGWLADIASVLKVAGRINLAIPEKTMTFDVSRALTTPAQMLDAYSRELRQPDFRQVFDHIAFVQHPGEGVIGEARRADRVREAYGVAQEGVRRGLYLDVHCHVWTSDSWQECWRVIEMLGLLPLRSVEVFPARADSAEFIVSLERIEG